MESFAVESWILYEVVFVFLNLWSAKIIFQACLVAQIEDLGLLIMGKLKKKQFQIFVEIWLVLF